VKLRKPKPEPKFCFYCGAPLERRTYRRGVSYDQQTGERLYASIEDLFCTNPSAYFGNGHSGFFYHSPWKWEQV
jgi:hypothetical protein